MIGIIKNFFASQWGGMISGLLTSAFIALLKLLFDYIRTTKSEYSGVWIDAVYDKDNNIDWRLFWDRYLRRLVFEYVRGLQNKPDLLRMMEAAIV
mgnify:CR=1 FL=1